MSSNFESLMEGTEIKGRNMEQEEERENLNQINDKLGEFSHSPWKYLKITVFRAGEGASERNSQFKFQELQNLHLGT